jgi:hypothetical protein
MHALHFALCSKGLLSKRSSSSKVTDISQNASKRVYRMNSVEMPGAKDFSM